MLKSSKSNNSAKMKVKNNRTKAKKNNSGFVFKLFHYYLLSDVSIKAFN